jgi:hypothetical protein
MLLDRNAAERPRTGYAPRRVGGFLFALSLALIAFDLYLLKSTGSFFPMVLIGSGGTLPVSIVMMVIGRPLDPATGKPLLWWNVLACVASFAGTAFGFWYSSALTH